LKQAMCYLSYLSDHRKAIFIVSGYQFIIRHGCHPYIRAYSSDLKVRKLFVSN